MLPAAVGAALAIVVVAMPPTAVGAALGIDDCYLFLRLSSGNIAVAIPLCYQGTDLSVSSTCHMQGWDGGAAWNRSSVAISRHQFVSPVVSGWFPLVGINLCLVDNTVDCCRLLLFVSTSTPLPTLLVCFSGCLRIISPATPVIDSSTMFYRLRPVMTYCRSLSSRHGLLSIFLFSQFNRLRLVCCFCFGSHASHPLLRSNVYLSGHSDRTGWFLRTTRSVVSFLLSTDLSRHSCYIIDSGLSWLTVDPYLLFVSPVHSGVSPFPSLLMSLLILHKHLLSPTDRWWPSGHLSHSA
jgi:hypothetical protein